MAWEQLRTDYKDAVWQGLRKYVKVDNGDNTISLVDVTVYTVYDEAFFGALDANRINTAVNAIMAALENGTDLYEVFTEFFENQKKSFQEKATLDLEVYEIFIDKLKATANSDINTMKKNYTAEIEQFEKNQESLFTQWFDMVKGQLSTDIAGNLQNEIDELKTHVRNLAVKIHINDTVGTAAKITLTNKTTGTVYEITNHSEVTYITEAGSYSVAIDNSNYMVLPKSFDISNTDLMTHKTIKVMDGNGFAFVDGYVGSYVNK